MSKFKELDADYLISSDGYIKSGKSDKILKSYPNPNGYCYTHIYVSGKRKKIYLHRAVAKCFLGEKEDGMQINHKDGNKSNNCADNLEYCTPRENIIHAHLLGIGGKNKTKEILQYSIEDEFIKKWNSISEACKYFNISNSSLSLCLSGRSKTSGGYKWKYYER